MADTFVCLLFTAVGIVLTFKGYMKLSDDETLPFMAIVGWPLIFVPLIFLLGWRTSGFIFQVVNTGLLAVMFIGIFINIFLTANNINSEYRDSKREQFGAFLTSVMSYLAMISELLILPLILYQISGGNGAELLRSTLELITRGDLVLALLGLFNEAGRMLFGYVFIFLGVFVLPAVGISIVLMLGWLIMDSAVGEAFGLGAMILRLIFVMIMPFAVMIYVILVKIDAGYTTVEWSELPVLHIMAIAFGNLLGGGVLSAMIQGDDEDGRRGRRRFFGTTVCFLIYTAAHFIVVPLFVWIVRGIEFVPVSFSLLFGMMFKGGIWLLGITVSSSILCLSGASNLEQLAGFAAAGFGDGAGGSKEDKEGSAKAKKTKSGYSPSDLPERIWDRSGNLYESYTHNTPEGSERREYVCAKTGQTVTITYVYSWYNGIIMTRQGEFLDH
ncbi:MAG: hypothetical protein IJM17_01160 [Firmicutes bacterium]|nr:hypothetical protein [Bacillota bacterium]